MKTIQLETEGYQPPKSGLVLLQCLVGLLFFTFVIRFWYLQIHRGADFAQQAQANHLRQESVYASRGLIRDVKGTLLAENRPAFGLALIREDCKDISATLAQVSEWAGIPLEQLTNRFQQDRRKVKPFEPILLRHLLCAQQRPSGSQGRTGQCDARVGRSGSFLYGTSPRVFTLKNTA